ncbi:MAG: thymidine phosphorylase, partial [Anaerolineae bacterium]|nr:thymidine phosphorylase [Anaerolineae bacterium]NIQ81450.1 thymidine phosphorylase [Anaerolineae bacterium]
MSFVAKIVEIHTDRRVAVLNDKDAAKLALKEGDRVKIYCGGRSASAILSVSSKLVAEGEAGVFDTLNDVLQVRDGERVELKISEAPQSVQFLKKKMMEGVALTKVEIRAIVEDIVSLDLSDLEMAAFVMSQHFRGMNMDETEALTRSMVETGETIEFERPV